MMSSIVSNESIRESYCASLFFNTVPHVLNSLAHSVMGVFKRIITFPGVIQVAGCNKLPLPLGCRGLREITSHNTQGDGIMIISDGLVQRELVRYVITRILDLATKLRLKPPIRFISSKDPTSVEGSTVSNEIIFYLNKDLFKHSKNEIDFIVARELARVALNHCRIRAKISLSLYGLDVIGALLISPWMVPLIEGVAAPIENAVRRKQELSADMLAIRVLNASEGALSYLSNMQASTLSMLLYHLLPSQLVQLRIDPKGDSRVDLSYPSLSKRIAQASAFKSTRSYA